MTFRSVAGLLALASTAALVAPAVRAIEPPPPIPGLPPAQAAATRPAATAPAAATPGLPAAPAATTAAITSNREIVLELRKRTISLMEGTKVLGKWPVAIGDPATPTPTGRYSIRNKVVNPQYQSTKSGKNNPTIGPNGPLGDRWIGFHATAKDQFGIHGTPPAWAWAVNQGAAVTQGCVRMLGTHVRALFDQVDVGTPVVVKP
jgi:lipoprotein-anchoring transpeptidase ErfK/SrfK